MTRLKNKVAIIYGNGGVGKAIAKAFAKEGAKVYLTGRTLEKLKIVADEIFSAGGDIEIAELDALDEQAVEKHMSDVIKKSGRIDISFNAVGIAQTLTQGTKLTELSPEKFTHPVTTYIKTQFITAIAAARQMEKQGAGVIITHTPTPGRLSQPFMGGMSSTWAAIEALYRSISVECGEFGVRSVCLLTTAIPETPLIDEVYNIHGKARGTDYGQFLSAMESRTHRRRLTSIEELTNAAIFVASEGTAITGTILNMTAGMIVY